MPVGRGHTAKEPKEQFSKEISDKSQLNLSCPTFSNTTRQLGCWEPLGMLKLLTA